MNEFESKPCSHRYQDIPVGMREQRDYVISADVYEHFLAGFGDRSPIHVDETYARNCGFVGKVMHGTLLNGFLSHFVGMYFPGEFSLLLTVDLRFAEPSYLDDVVQLETVVVQKLDVRNVLVMSVKFTNTTRNWIAARGRVQVMVRDEA